MSFKEYLKEMLNKSMNKPDMQNVKTSKGENMNIKDSYIIRASRLISEEETSIPSEELISDYVEEGLEPFWKLIQSKVMLNRDPWKQKEELKQVAIRLVKILWAGRGKIVST